MVTQTPLSKANQRSPADRFEDFLQSRGMRNTQQRRMMLDVVFSQAGIFDADQLIEQLPARSTPGYVSRPTVYRTLAEFVEAGLLQKFELEGRSVYQPGIGSEHTDHFFCVECRELSEFVSPAIVESVQQVANERGFQVAAHRLVVSGTCSDCRQRRRRTKRRVDLV